MCFLCLSNITTMMSRKCYACLLRCFQSVLNSYFRQIALEFLWTETNLFSSCLVHILYLLCIHEDLKQIDFPKGLQHWEFSFGQKKILPQFCPHLKIEKCRLTFMLPLSVLFVLIQNINLSLH